MNSSDTLPNKMNSVLSGMKRYRTLLLTLSAVVVFVVSYLLILPALTLDHDEAEKQGGITLSVESSETKTDSPDASEDNQTPSTQEKSDKSSEQIAEKKSDKNDKQKLSSDEPLVFQAGELFYDGKAYDIKASYQKEAEIPEQTELQVEEITKKNEKYDQYYKEALEAVQKDTGKKTESEFSFSRFYDISLNAGGTEVEPADKMHVTISYDQGMPAEDADHIKIIHFVEDEKTGEITPEVLDQKETDFTVKKEKMTEASFDAESFSVYAVIYTVDFHYEVNGQMYDFSMPGGGYISCEKLALDLGLVKDKTVEAAKEFVADIKDISFSNPALLWVGKVNETTTVGTLKKAQGLESSYSAELTDKEIKKINAQTIEAGDWAFISLKEFDTDETLTVTMRNGDQFEIKVTDYQNATSMSEFDGTTQFVIWTEVNGVCYVLKTDGSTEAISADQIDALGQDYLWTVQYGWQQAPNDFRYIIKAVTNPQTSLTLNWDNQPLVQNGECGIRFYPHSSQNDAWYLEGWNWTRLWLNPSTHDYEGSRGQNTGNYSWMHFSKQEELEQFEFTVAADNNDVGQGNVSGIDKDGTNQVHKESYNAITSGSKTNRNDITADPSSNRYIFDYWDLNGQTLYWDPATETISTTGGSGRNTDFSLIPAGKLTVPYNTSTLTAHFKRNPDYEVPDDEKEGRMIDKEALDRWLSDLETTDFPLNEEGCNKTAELYDYENRIYRVDLTAQSNLSALAGTIDLGFMIDVSASMKFPSKLDMVSRWNNTQTTSDRDQQLLLELYKINDNDTTKRWLNQSKTYYIIADKTGTATVDAIKYNGSEWQYKDSSKDDSAYKTINHDTKFHNNDATGLTYPIYLDGDNGRPRSYYLENSLTNTITEMQDILDVINVAQNPSEASDVEIAWNTFCNSLPNVTDGTKKSVQHEFQSVSNGGISLNYAYNGGTSTDVALLDAAGMNRDDINDRYDDTDRKNWKKTEADYNASNPVYTEGNNGFEWGDSATKYAILITDGAPQRSSVAVYSKYVEDAAQHLKDKGVTLITVGLSMGDVKRGSVLLYDIASTDKNGDPYFYSAESGDELEYVLLEIIRQIMADAITVGTVTDTVNEAFYPVDKNTGAILQNGNVIDLNGVKIADKEDALTENQRKAGYGVVTVSNVGKYTVTWSGQDFTWQGWHGTIYEKAKEDFLGGNAVRTNDPNHPATIVPTGYKVDADDDPIAFKNEIVTGKTITKQTPRVNVNELNLTENSTEWTVYLGTEVSPKEQLQELYNHMQVEQVVTAAIDTNDDGLPDSMVHSDGSDMYYPLEESASDRREEAASGERKGYLLKDLLKNLHGDTDVTIDELIEAGDEGLTWTYDLYGQDNPGTINIKLVKTEKANYEKHVTIETGTPVETYSISVLFTPEYAHIPAGQGGDGSLPYNTGYYGLGTYGNAAGTEKGLNVHNINVFAKRLQLYKVDQEHNLLDRSEAKFALYREATSDEMDDSTVEKVSVEGLTGQYVLVQSLTTVNGIVTTDVLPLLEGNKPYYLVEAEAPDGYNALTEPLRVNIDMNNHNTWTSKIDGVARQTKPEPYVLSDWLQEAIITVTDKDGESSSSAIRVVPQGEGISYNHENDTTKASATYMIINESGVELPYTGGIGTTLFYILGMVLSLGAGVVLVLKAKKGRSLN